MPPAYRHTTAAFGWVSSDSPAQLDLAFVEGPSGAVLADGGHAHNDLSAHFDRLPCPTEWREVGSGGGRPDRIEFNPGECFGVLNGEHRDGGLARPVDDGREVELPPLRIGHRP